MHLTFVYAFVMAVVFTNSHAPVVLKDFSATASGCNALLKWTAIDYAGSSYDIESSSNGVDFITVKTLLADSLSGENIYAVTLSQTDAAKWYRLKINSNDSSIIYSRLAAVNIRCGKQSSFLAYPNPVTDKLSINFEAAAAMQVSVWVNDAAGKTMVKKDVTMQTGANSLVLDMQALPPGLYYLQLRNSDRNIEASQKVMKK